MRLVTYGAACSLDGYIAGPGHEVDWLKWSEDVAALTNALWARIDTVLMGRRTYEVAVSSGLTAYPGVQNIVFSRSLRAADWPDVTIVPDDPAAYVRNLKAEAGGEICVMGGGVIAKELLAADLIDEIGVNVQPVILGGGIPLLPAGGRRVELILKESRILKGGCVYALYRVGR
jgi:dihydrofolate reductase